MHRGLCLKGYLIRSHPSGHVTVIYSYISNLQMIPFLDTHICNFGSLF